MKLNAKLTHIFRCNFFFFFSGGNVVVGNISLEMFKYSKYIEN